MEGNNDSQILDNNIQTGQEGDKKPKMYTQEEINESFNAGVRKANSDWQKDEKYKEFLEWKKKSKSETEQISQLTDNNLSLTNEIKQLKAQIEVNNSNVKKEFSKFVTSEVMNLVDETTDFETALKGYKKNNPQFFGETVIKKVQSSPSLNGGEKPESTNSIMNDILRNARNNNN